MKNLQDIIFMLAPIIMILFIITLVADFASSNLESVPLHVYFMIGAVIPIFIIAGGATMQLLSRYGLCELDKTEPL